MKKLLAITLVLGLAAVASAVPVITVNASGDAPYPVAMGDTLTFTVMSTDVVAWGGIVYLDPTAYPGGSLTGEKTDAAGALGALNDLSGAPFNKPGAYQIAVAGVGDGAPTPNETQFTFTYTATDDHSASSIVLWDSQLNPLPGANITQVDIQNTPEPITLSLLGLGGLFLRRRR